MCKPKIYYVNGTAVAEVGEHVFKGVICGYGNDTSQLEAISDVLKLTPDKDGLYYLEKEGNNLDYGENYLIASQGVTAGGCRGQDGSIGAIQSPLRSFKEYKDNIQAIKDLLELKLDYELNRKLLRFLFIGVCGEMEGYLSSTIIALVQGVREVFLCLREFEDSVRQPDEHKWRDALVDKLNEKYNFSSIKNIASKERKIYEKLLGTELILSQELINDMEWRNKLVHRVAFHSKSAYPRKEDVLSFIEQANSLVDSIDGQIARYKKCWLEEL